jgi:RimJ/RimL family protein N-acetyltransferase
MVSEPAGGQIRPDRIDTAQSPATSPHTFLQTPRLLFRPWTAADLGLALGLWRDAVVTEWIGGPFSEEEVRARLAREIATFAAHGVQYWPLVLRTSGEHVGCCGLRPYREKEGVYELGFHLHAAHWGRGYASEAARAVIGYGFDALGASALFAGHHPNNSASRRLLEKLGFRYTHDEFYPPTRLHHPSYLLTVEDFRADAPTSP